jgi:hypothetical protein
MRRRSAAVLRAATALLVAAALPSGAAAAVRGRAHAPTAGEQDCAACHRTGTPAAFADWEGSPHGLALVKCVVCHGSTGKDFRAKPAATGCGSCHAAQASSMARRAVSDCFACHAPHTLSAHPHR